jgi:hypothetical protein
MLFENHWPMQSMKNKPKAISLMVPHFISFNADLANTFSIAKEF